MLGRTGSTTDPEPGRQTVFFTPYRMLEDVRERKKIEGLLAFSVFGNSEASSMGRGGPARKAEATSARIAEEQCISALSTGGTRHASPGYATGRQSLDDGGVFIFFVCSLNSARPRHRQCQFASIPHGVARVASFAELLVCGMIRGFLLFPLPWCFFFAQPVLQIEGQPKSD